MNQSITRKLLNILCVVLIAAMALCAAGCGKNNTTQPTTQSTTEATEATAAEVPDTESPAEPSIPADVTVKGEGQTSFYLNVTDADGTVTKFLVKTDKTTVGEALLELELITGTASDYGLYITAVNGITADWDTEKAYWAFYIGDEYAQTGVDTTNITPDAVYSLVKTVSE